METQQQTTLANIKKNAPVEIKPGFDSIASYEALQRVAGVFARSHFVPDQYKGEAGLPSCMIAVNIALRVKADPLLVMQNLVIVYNKPSWSAKYLIASANTCGRFTALRFEWFGEQGKSTWGCRAIATELGTGETLIGPDISIQLAIDEGWYEKKGSKWKTIPQKMLMYRAGAWWVDLYAPEISMGFRTAEEEYDIIDVDSDGNVTNVTTSNEQTSASLRRRRDVTPVEESTTQATEPAKPEPKDMNI